MLTASDRYSAKREMAEYDKSLRMSEVLQIFLEEALAVQLRSERGGNTKYSKCFCCRYYNHF